MKLDITKEKGVTIITVREKKIDATVSADLKAEFLLLGKARGTKKLIVDLAEVQFCDSSGLSAFLIADRTMREHGGSNHLVNVQKKVLDLLKLSLLDRMFIINKSDDEALEY